MGVIASLVAVGGGLGIVLAGPIVNALSYHWLFWLPMILTVAAAVAAHFLVPESPNTHLGPDQLAARGAAVRPGWSPCWSR